MLLPCPPTPPPEGGTPADTSFALRVYGLDRSLGDCVAFGQDPQVILDGTYVPTNGLPPDETELSSCRIASF